jgi:hypothetical protein
VNPTATGQIAVNATPDTVYGLITDLGSVGDLAEETVSVAFLDGASGPAVGVRFRGRNRRGVRRWSTVSTVTDVEPGEQFAFNVASFGIPVARWQYLIETADNGCVVTESTWDRRPNWFLGVGRLVTGVADRTTVNTQNIATTLSRLKAKAEKQ